MVWSKPEDLSEVGERAIHVILVVQAQSAHIDCVNVNTVELEDVVSSLLGLGISEQSSWVKKFNEKCDI